MFGHKEEFGFFCKPHLERFNFVIIFIFMELNKYSKAVTQDPTQPAAQAMLHAIGLTDEDFKKPSLALRAQAMRGIHATCI